MKRILITFLAALVLGGQARSQGQTLDDQEVVDIEGLYKNQTAPPVKEPEPTVTIQDAATEGLEAEAAAQSAPSPPAAKVENLTDLNKLAPFREVSVIQKKYLPKTERFQIFGGVGMTTNSPWFLNLGGKIALGYHFTESLGVELTGAFLSNSERDVAKEIRDQHDLEPEKFVTTKSYVGADLFWSPIYGKISFLNDRIIPFDMYFTFGGGSSTTNSEEKTVPTFHLGTGQIFALSKSTAFRWDYSWNHFSATPVGGAKSDYDDLVFTLGLSFFFPEAKYR